MPAPASRQLQTFLGRLEPRLFKALVELPDPVVRRLAGRPVVIDGQTLDTETQWMLRLQRLLGEPGPETLPMAEAREAILRQARLAGGSQPIGETRDLDVPGAEGPIPARLYVPRSQVGPDRRDWPLLVYLHGGGMMYGGLDSYDALCRFLAERADVRVLSVDYRLAPEHPFPAAIEDCWAAFRWVSEHAHRFEADPERIAVGGDSAGGYLSALTALRAADEGVPLLHQLLVYPVTDMAGETESRRLFGDGFYLTSDFIELSESHYLEPSHDRRDPQVSVLYTERIPEGLAAATVVTAGFDPLRDEGEAYAQKLAEAGVPVDLTRYPGLIHSFWNIVGVGRSNRAAVAEVAAKLKATLVG